MSRYMFRRVLAVWMMTVALLAATSAAFAETRSYTVTAPDGVKLAVQESGNPDGPAIIFIHGLLGSHLNWEAQLKSPQLRGYRIITYDMRGHGLSEKPVEAEAYVDGRRWADDLSAVIESSHVRNPLLVGWSLGGTVISNYLAAYGDRRIAGAVYVGGVIELKPEQIVAHPDVYRDLSSSDLRTNLDAQRAFLSLCFHTQPDAVTFQRLLANAAMASWDMQRAVHSMTVSAAQGLGTLQKPLLLIYGAHDALVQAKPSIARAMELNPGIQSKLYPDSGHAPFLEESDRFNRDLADFAETILSR